MCKFKLYHQDCIYMLV